MAFIHQNKIIGCKDSNFTISLQIFQAFFVFLAIFLWLIIQSLHILNDINWRESDTGSGRQQETSSVDCGDGQNNEIILREMVIFG